MADEIGNKLGGAAEKADELISGFDRLMIKTVSLVGLEEKQIEATLKSNKLQAQLDREKKKSVPLQRKMTIELQQRLKQSTLLTKGLKETIKGMNLFTKTLGGIGKGVGGLAKGIGAIGKAGVIGGLVVGVKFLIDGLLKVDAGMATLSKRLGVTRAEMGALRTITEEVTNDLGRFGINFEQVTAEVGNLALQFGRIDLVTTKLVTTSLRLQRAYGVSAQASGELLESLTRSGVAADAFVANIGVRARKAGVLTNLVIKDLAANAQMIAIQSRRGLESMKNMAIAAAESGGSLKDFDGLKNIYSDVERTTMAIMTASQAMNDQSGEIQSIMGNALELRMLYETGQTDVIMARARKAALTLLDINKEGELVRKGILNSEGEQLILLESQKKAMAGLLGEEVSTFITRSINDQKREKAQAAFMKKSATERTAILEAAKKQKQAEIEKAAEQEYQNQLLEDQASILERVSQIASGIFDRVAMNFSLALGVDDPKGPVRDTINKIGEYLEKTLRFDTLQADIAKGGGGFDGFVSAMADRMKPLFTFVKNQMIAALEMAFNWIGENVNFNPGALIPGVGGPLFSTKAGDAQRNIEDAGVNLAKQ